MPSGFETLRLDVNGYRFDAIARGAADAPLVLFLHGWPSLANCWREIMTAAASAGFRAVAVDQRGYSPGARPPEIADYSIDRLLADIEGFAQALGGDARFHLSATIGAALSRGLMRRIIPGGSPRSASSRRRIRRRLSRRCRSDPEQQRMSAYIGDFPPARTCRRAGFIEGRRTQTAGDLRRQMRQLLRRGQCRAPQ